MKLFSGSTTSVISPALGWVAYQMNCNLLIRSYRICSLERNVRIKHLKIMPFVKEQKFTKTPFKKQADVLSAILRTNPMMNDDEKVSVQETVGVLTWLNMLQIHWAKNKEQAATSAIPKDIFDKIFEGRGPQSPVNPVERI